MKVPKSGNLDEIREIILKSEPTRPSSMAASSEGEDSQNRGLFGANKLQRQLKGDLDKITLKAIRKEPERRYASAEQLRADLQRYKKGVPVIAQRDSLLYRTSKFIQRNRLGVSLGALIFLMVVGFSFRENRLRVDAESARMEADNQAQTAQEVSDFLQELFTVSDPNRALGETITVREVLDRGAREIQAGLAGQPEVRARLQHVIGSVYQNMGLYEEAAVLHESALKLVTVSLRIRTET